MSYGCNLCALGSASFNTQIDPKGSTNPDYYIIGYVSSEVEVKNNNPFDPNSSRTYSYLNSVLNSLGINELNCRFNKMIRCISENRNINDDHKKSCINYLINDIVASKPKIIIGLGSEVGSTILGDKFKYISTSRGRLYDVELGGHKCKFLVTYSPSYIIQSISPGSSESDEESGDKSEISDNFFSDLSYCVKFVENKLVDISSKDLRFALTYDEFKKYYDEFLDGVQLPAYDIESNAKDPRCSDFRIVGFSLAPNGHTGIYIVRKSLEYEMSKEDWDKCVELTKSYLSSRTTLVHNIMYEKPATLNEWNFNIINFEDSLIKARLLLGGKTGAGLKEQCVLNLGYPEWEVDLTEYKEYFTILWSNLYPTPAGNNRWDYDVLVEKGIYGLRDTYLECDRAYKEVLSRYPEYPNCEMSKEDSKILKENTLKTKEYDNIDAINNLEGLLANYYSQDEIVNIMELVGKELVSLIEIRYDGMLPYSSIPMRIITKYGAMDSVGTQDLNEFLSARLTNESTEDVKLWDGYNVMKRHFTVGTHLEMNGLYWNEEVATSTKNWLSGISKKALVDMLLSGYLDESIIKNGMYVLTDYVKDNMMDYVEEKLGSFVMQKTGIKIIESGRRISYKNLIYELGDEFIQSNRDLILRLNKEKIVDESIHPDYVSLKYLFNPGSNSNTELLNSILVDTNVQIGYVISRLNQMIDTEGFTSDSQPMPDKLMFDIILNIRSYNKSVDEYNDSEEVKNNPELKKTKITQKQIFDKIYNAIQNINPRGYDLMNIIRDAVQYKMPGASEPVIIELYDYYKSMGIDIEDESTWTDQFRFLYNFRLYKKCTKLISSYIDGNKIGRGSVWVVSKGDILSNSVMPIRTKKYDWNNPKRDDEEYILQSSWGVCTADTLRWRAGVHTIPAGPAVKSIYTSRYKGGVVAAPDYSQLEVRIAAGLSNCKSLLDAFANGEDVHLRTACGIFNKPPEEITKVERRYSKMATFRILYGSSAEGMAAQFLDGDIELAHKIIDGFYNSYPEIKVMMDKRHNEVLTMGKVSCDRVGYFIYIPNDGTPQGIEEAKRMAGNYPIQSQGSMIGGYVLNEVNQYCLDNHLYTKPISFIHDSLEFDIHPDEFFVISKQIIPMMNKIPIEQFGIPTKADLTIGLSMGDENEVKSIDCDESFNSGVVTFEGFRDNLDNLYNHWKNHYKVVEYEDGDDVEEIYVPMSDLFMPKLAISPYNGKKRQIITRTFKLILK